MYPVQVTAFSILGGLACHFLSALALTLTDGSATIWVGSRRTRNRKQEGGGVLSFGTRATQHSRALHYPHRHETWTGTKKEPWPRAVPRRPTIGHEGRSGTVRPARGRTERKLGRESHRLFCCVRAPVKYPHAFKSPSREKEAERVSGTFDRLPAGYLPRGPCSSLLLSQAVSVQDGLQLPAQWL